MNWQIDPASLVQLISDHPLMAALALGTLALVPALLARWWGERHREMRFDAAQTTDLEIRTETYDDASRKYQAHLNYLVSLRDKPVVIELIHDTGDDFLDRDEAAKLITFDDAFELIRRIKNAQPGQPIYVILHTLGGYSLPSIMIADAIHQHRGPVTAFIPYIAMSGGTVSALASSLIWMGPVARIGPIDTVFYGISGETLDQLKAKKSEALQDDATILHRLEAEKYDRFSRKEMKRLAHSAHQAKAVRQLSSGELSHAHALTRADAEALGLRVNGPGVHEIAKPVCRAVIGIVDERLHMIRKFRDKGKGPRGSAEKSPAGELPRDATAPPDEPPPATKETRPKPRTVTRVA